MNLLVSTLVKSRLMNVYLDAVYNRKDRGAGVETGGKFSLSGGFGVE